MTTSESRELIPVRVLCPTHGRVPLTDAEYRAAQARPMRTARTFALHPDEVTRMPLAVPDVDYRCPICTAAAQRMEPDPEPPPETYPLPTTLADGAGWPQRFKPDADGPFIFVGQRTAAFNASEDLGWTWAITFDPEGGNMEWGIFATAIDLPSTIRIVICRWVWDFLGTPPGCYLDQREGEYAPNTPQEMLAALWGAELLAAHVAALPPVTP